MRAKQEKKDRAPDECLWEATVNLRKATYKIANKRKAPKAIKAIREFARKMTGTPDIRIEDSLNKFVWSKGIRAPPGRVRILLTRQRNNDDEAEHKLYTLVSHLEVASFKGRKPHRIEQM